MIVFVWDVELPFSMQFLCKNIKNPTENRLKSLFYIVLATLLPFYKVLTFNSQPFISKLAIFLSKEGLLSFCFNPNTLAEGCQ